MPDAPESSSRPWPWRRPNVGAAVLAVAIYAALALIWAVGPDATLERIRPRGTEPLAIAGYDSGFVQHGPLELETVRLTGGT